MCGILLARPKAPMEAINDINDRLVNWWRVTRDSPEEFADRLAEHHQLSRTGFQEAKDGLDCEDPIMRAVNYTIVMRGSFSQSDHDGAGWATSWAAVTRPIWTRDEIYRVRERTATVQIENMDAVEFLDRAARHDRAVIYCDPPYESADNSSYRQVPDWDDLKAVLRRQKGRVAISGFNDDFDCLGWHVSTLERGKMAFNPKTREMVSIPRVEKLWMNYDPPQRGLFA